MKTILFSLLLALSSVTFAVEKNITVNVKGMVCAFCAQGITKKFNSEPTISKVDVSLEKKIVKLSTKEGQDIPDSKIEIILKDSGFTVEKINRDAK